MTTLINSLSDLVWHHYEITQKDNGVIVSEMAKVPISSLMDASTLVTGSIIRETVKAFSLGLMASDTREIVQKSSSAHSWFWLTHQTSWMIIIYAWIMGGFKDDKMNGRGLYTWASGDRYERHSSQIIFNTFMRLINTSDIVDDHHLWTNNGTVERW